MTETEQSHRTAACGRLFVSGLLVGLLVLLGRVAQLKVHPPQALLAAASPSISTRSQLARRGDLLDARGRLIATSTVGYRLPSAAGLPRFPNPSSVCLS